MVPCKIHGGIKCTVDSDGCPQLCCSTKTKKGMNHIQEPVLCVTPKWCKTVNFFIFSIMVDEKCSVAKKTREYRSFGHTKQFESQPGTSYSSFKLRKNQRSSSFAGIKHFIRLQPQFQAVFLGQCVLSVRESQEPAENRNNHTSERASEKLPQSSINS